MGKKRQVFFEGLNFIFQRRLDIGGRKYTDKKLETSQEKRTAFEIVGKEEM